MHILVCCGHTRNVQRKYKSEAGESMGKPEKKLKKILRNSGNHGVSIRSIPLSAAPCGSLSVCRTVCSVALAVRTEDFPAFAVESSRHQERADHSGGRSCGVRVVASFCDFEGIVSLGGRKLFQELVVCQSASALGSGDGFAG